MANILIKQDSNLPANIEDLTKFVLVGREKLTSVKAEIRLIDKLNLAKDVRDQKKDEAQMLAEALLDAETKIGELLRELPRTSLRSEDQKTNVGSTKTLPDGISWNQSLAFQKMAKHKDIVEQVKAEAREKDELPTRTEVLETIKKKENSQTTHMPHISYNSGNNEWYTPPEYVEAARRILGEIDLDPASNELANTVIKAKKIYTIEDNGLDKIWQGNIWLNPPYSSDLIPKFIEKLNDELSAGNVNSAIVLVNNATETKWFKSLVFMASLICFPTGRIKYWGIDGNINTPLQGQAIIYIGDHIIEFRDEFKKFGWIAFV